MQHKEVWLFGLFALACLYLDTLPARAEARPAEPVRPRTPALPTAAPAPSARMAAGTCPRDRAHLVRSRPDGAVWCLICDEGFFPSLGLPGSPTGRVAA